MKALVVYYSRTGTTKKVADEIVRLLKCDSERILDVKDRSGPLGYMRSGKEGMKRIIPEIKETEKDPSKYDIVILGTPIWGWNMASPMRAYLAKNSEKLGRVAFFITQGGKGAETAFREMEDICSSVPKATLVLLTKEVMKTDWSSRVKDFVDRLSSDGSDAKDL
ncbi:hypothetical protein KY359_04055 [Candidatus Woesearchaeota archaeon]|nr:hypothetical protein [Candidatus Woesearchaeota archaeon]